MVLATDDNVRIDASLLSLSNLIICVAPDDGQLLAAHFEAKQTSLSVFIEPVD